MDTSAEVGERASVTIVLHEFAPHIDGYSNEDCTVKDKWIRVHSEPIFSRDCIVEAG